MTFQDALDRQGVKYKQGNTDHRKISICCPFCPERGRPADTKFRLCVHVKAGWGKCVHCEWKSRRAIRFVLRKLQIEYDTVEGAGVDTPTEPLLVTLPEDFQLLGHSNLEDWNDFRAKEYLLKRGITEQQIVRCRIGVSYTGRYAWRVIFPLYYKGVLKGIVGRDFTGRLKPKYLFNKGTKFLYHFNSQQDTCILSEGVIKALRIQQETQACSAGLLGHTLTDEQLKQIAESKCRNIVIYPDPDKAGLHGTVSIADKLCENWSGTVKVVWPVTTPADEETLDGIRQSLANTQFYCARLRVKINLGNS